MKIFVYCLVLLGMVGGMADCFGKNFTQVQQLYKEVGSELIGLRKDFAAAQPKVYSVLDRVDKMYNLSKVIHEKKKNFKKLAKTHDAELKQLRSENKSAKTELAALKQKFDAASKKLDQTHKQLESERTHLAKLSQEKVDLMGKINQIESEKKIIETEKSIKDLDEKVARTVEEEVAAQIKNLKDGQSLSLTSTSAPNSPR